MNFARLWMAAALGCLLAAPALAQQAETRTQPQSGSQRSAIEASEAAHQAPTVTPAQIAVEEPSDLAQSYARKAQPPPAGDPITVRKDFHPELRASVLDAE